MVPQLRRTAKDDVLDWTPAGFKARCTPKEIWLRSGKIWAPKTFQLHLHALLREKKVKRDGITYYRELAA
jgi:hypothetical protein